MTYLSIEGATIIDASGGLPIENGVILVEDGRIAQISLQGAVHLPPERLVIDAAGKYVTPGLIDAHNHLCIHPGDERVQMSAPDGTLMLRAARHARVDLSSGVTSMRTMGEKNLLDIQYKEGIARGLIPGPRVLTSAWPIASTCGQCWFFSRIVDSEAQAREAVRANYRDGADLIKLMISGGVSTERSEPSICYFSQKEIEVLVDEAHRLGVKVAGHLYGGLGADWAIAAGIDTVEHGTYLTEAQLDAMAANGTWLVATLGVYLIRREPDHRPPWQQRKAQEAAESCRKAFQMAREKGVRIALGADCHHEPLRMANELALAVELGMPEMEAIVTATRRGAEVCGIESDVGDLSPGKRADLLILRSNPIEDIRALKDIIAVMQDGKIVQREGGLDKE